MPLKKGRGGEERAAEGRVVILVGYRLSIIVNKRVVTEVDDGDAATGTAEDLLVLYLSGGSY